MTDYTVRRLALILSVQAEIEGMKVENSQHKIPVFKTEDFESKAAELKNLAYCHNENL